MNQRGSIYLFTSLIILFILMVDATLLTRSVSETNGSAGSYAQAATFHLAEAGVDQAAINLRTPTDLTDDVNAMTLPEGSFTIDSPPVSLGNQMWQVVTHGVSVKNPTVQRNIEAVFQLTPQSVFQFAVFGDRSVNVSGSATSNSFDSRLGPYNDTVGSPGYNVSHNGDVGTNATTAGGITVGGSIFIDGQVVVGPNVANPQSVITGYNPSFITGNPKVVSEGAKYPMPDVSVPAGLTCTDFTVTGNTTVTLSPTGGPNGNGVYCYHDLTLQGGGTLTASGPVTIYLTDDLVAKGNSVLGVSSDPTKMQVLMPSSASASLEQGTLTGSTQFYGALYGPKATINITGNATIYGSIIAQTVNVSGSADIHYDKALSTSNTTSNLYKTKLISWRER